jgi:hypothetical protein
VASIRKADHDSVGYGSDQPVRVTKSVELADDDPRIWGWHHSGDGRGLRIGGVVVAIVMALMAIGNHEGFVEDLWLFVIAAIMIGFVLISAASRRKSTYRR